MISQIVQINAFLDTEEHKQLLKYVQEKEPDFSPSSTFTKNISYRKSIVLHSFPEFSELILKKIQAIFPEIISKLNLPLFVISQIESQLTAHNHGDYYKVHNDNGSPDTSTRELTYVYYFYQEPQSFSGGELLIHDTKVENNVYVIAETFEIVQPYNNSIVFFLSRCLHEVLPVNCPSQAFKDSRFTINGWVRQ